MKSMIAGCVLILSLGGGAGLVAAQSAGDEAKKAGDAVKEAGKDTGEAAKHVGKATAKGTKKVVKKVKTTVKNAVDDKDTATCVDGTHQVAKTEAAAAAACVNHGGVAKQ